MRYAWIEWVLPFEAAGLLASLAVYYFMFHAFGGNAPFLQKYGGDYVSYLIIGVAANTLLTHALVSVYWIVVEVYRGSWTATGARLAMADYLEMARLPLSAYICSRAAWGYIESLLRVLVYLVAGLALFGMRPHGSANYAVAIISVILGVAACVGLSLISAAMIWMLGAWHGNEPLQWAIATLTPLVAGVYFPPELLPMGFGRVAEWLPQTHTLRVTRLALLGDGQTQQLTSELTWLVGGAVALLALGTLAFRRSVQMARAAGSLSG